VQAHYRGALNEAVEALKKAQKPLLVKEVKEKFTEAKNLYDKNKSVGLASV